MLTDRELATVAWLAIGLAAVALLPIFRDVRASLLECNKLLIHPKVAGPLLAYAAWIGAAIAVARAAGAWNQGLLKDTVVWFIVAGVPLVFRLACRANDEHFFSRAVRRTISVSVAVEFYVNLTAFPFWLELVLQPTAAVLMFGSIWAARDPESASARRAANRLLLAGGIALLLATTARLAGELGGLDKVETVRLLALPVWLTVAAIPFLFILGTGFDYDWASAQVGLAVGKRTPWRAKAALLFGLRLRGRPFRDFGGSAFPRRLAEAKSLVDARHVVTDYRTWEREKEAANARAAKRLRDFAGIKGTDADGHQLDQREFAETKDALELLAACQSGWYHNLGGRYRDDLVGMLGDSLVRGGLPTEHGIRMSVSEHGRSWYAWRRTITGWCLGMGASGTPPRQWLYEGPEPPHGPLGTDHAWRQSSADDRPDW